MTLSWLPRQHPAYLAALLVPLMTGDGQADDGYQKPPKGVLDVLNAPPPPTALVSPTRERLLLVQGVNYPPISDLAEPMLRLAGHRISPQTNGPHRTPRVVSLALVNVADGKETKVEVPADARLGLPLWSPDGQRFAFTHTTPAGIELWVGSARSGSTQRLQGVVVNAAISDPVDWMPDGQTLLVQTVFAGRGQPPKEERVPTGPVVQESAGKAAPVRTYQDLLRNKYDEDLFDYYATSQLVLIDTKTGRRTPVGGPAILEGIDPSPDGKHFLVTRLHRPYSYLYPSDAFPKDVEVWDRTGQLEYKVASLPLEDQVPIEGVPVGPRQVRWRPTEPATLVWVEALDEGNPKKKVPFRDRVMLLQAPFKTKPVDLVKTEHRFAGLAWIEGGGQALLRDYNRDRRWGRVFLLDLDRPGEAPRLVWDRSILDRYNDPGTPLTRRLPSGHTAIQQHDGFIYLQGPGASPEGERPFLDRLQLATLKTERLFRCPDKTYESVTALLSADAARFLTRAESNREPPNYFVRTQGNDDRLALTHYADPSPVLRDIKKELVTYKRPDGVQLSFTLYLPPGYQQGTRLPTVVWAYPREFNDPGTAGQVSGSPYHFTTIGGPSHLFFLLQGYAVLDGATMPVVGDPETANNTYIDQVVTSARAAIAKAVEMGVTDRDRVGVGGHSYGAFMTANLLAHSDLFRAGIARSGAYNRTLTPFGFQSERRTIWEAPEVYAKMSPFMAADRIKAALLLIHGEADDNPGTFPVQSERMYQAVRGNGGTVRFVQLPYEAHGYQARESVEHTLYEMIGWFDKHVKNAPPISK